MFSLDPNSVENQSNYKIKHSQHCWDSRRASGLAYRAFDWENPFGLKGDQGLFNLFRDSFSLFLYFLSLYSSVAGLFFLDKEGSDIPFMKARQIRAGVP